MLHPLINEPMFIHPIKTHDFICVAPDPHGVVLTSDFFGEKPNYMNLAYNERLRDLKRFIANPPQKPVLVGGKSKGKGKGKVVKSSDSIRGVKVVFKDPRPPMAALLASTTRIVGCSGSSSSTISLVNPHIAARSPSKEVVIIGCYDSDKEESEESKKRKAVQTAKRLAKKQKAEEKVAIKAEIAKETLYGTAIAPDRVIVEHIEAFGLLCKRFAFHPEVWCTIQFCLLHYGSNYSKFHATDSEGTFEKHGVTFAQLEEFFASEEWRLLPQFCFVTTPEHKTRTEEVKRDAPRDLAIQCYKHFKKHPNHPDHKFSDGSPCQPSIIKAEGRFLR